LASAIVEGLKLLYAASVLTNRLPGLYSGIHDFVVVITVLQLKVLEALIIYTETRRLGKSFFVTRSA
jgi:hypothetical protein